jgi:hypothetical protein
VGHASASPKHHRADDNLDLGITGPDDNLYLDHLVGSPRGDVLPGGRQRWTTEGDVIQNFRSKTEREFNYERNGNLTYVLASTDERR